MNGKPRIAVRTASLGGDLRAGLDLVAKSGLSGVRLDVGGLIDPPSLSRTGRREIAALLRGRELRGFCLGANLGRPLDEPQGLEERLSRIAAIFQFATDITMGAVVLHTGNPKEPPPEATGQDTPAAPVLSPLLGGVLTSRPAAKTDPASRFRALLDTLDFVARLGERTGVVPALDPGGFPLGDLALLLRSRNLPGCGIHWDPATQWQAGMRPSDVLGQPELWRERPFFVVGRDWKRDMAAECAPGQGDLDWPAMMMELCAGGFTGPIVAERQTSAVTPREVIGQALALQGMIP